MYADFCFLPILPAASISSGEKSKNRKWFFEKRGLPKREIRLNMQFFAAYGMNVQNFHFSHGKIWVVGTGSLQAHRKTSQVNYENCTLRLRLAAIAPMAFQAFARRF